MFIFYLFMYFYLVLLVRLAAQESDECRLDLHGLSTVEAVHVLRTTLSEREAGMCK